MKILFFSSGLTHYFNRVLSRINAVPGIELTNVIPSNLSGNIGAGVYQTREGISFRVIELEEYTRFGLYSSFRGLTRLLLSEKPDIVMVSELHLLPFVFSPHVLLMKRLFNIKIVLKSIPFRLPRYDEAKKRIEENTAPISVLPKFLDGLLRGLGLVKTIRMWELRLRKAAYNSPDAHVNYIDEAFDIFGSYGVPKEKIFITRNSPDTDMLFEVRDAIKSLPSVLPDCGHRLVHVGRLVEWKRVDMLLRVFARLREQFSDAELLIIGDGPQDQALKDLALQLGIAPNVTFLGAIHDPKTLGQYLMASTIYVLAGMGGLSINDAMCFGLPVVCSVGDGTEKVLVRDEINGKYFRDGDEDDLTDKIRYLFNNPDLCKRMGEKSTEIIRNEVNIHTVVEGYISAFRHVADRVRA